MIPELREQFNRTFTPQRYQSFVEDVNQAADYSLEFRLCETPLFLDDSLRDRLLYAVEDIVKQLRLPDFRAYCQSAIPPGYTVFHEDEHPTFLQIDFALCQDDNDRYLPQLIELQGFPSLYCFQHLLDLKIRDHFDIPGTMSPYYNGYNADTYVEFLRQTIIGDCDPENVILLEIEPDKQKTRVDFICTEKLIGVKPLCLSQVFKRGKHLFYQQHGKYIPIKRVYSRVIFDELIRKNFQYQFDLREDLNVHWVGHPNWFFKISKHTLPFLKSRFVPTCYALDQLDNYPRDLENYVLKPLFSFAGSGVIIDVSPEKITAIDNPENYILQRKIKYAPILQTPDDPAKVEIRMMLLWPDDEPQPTLVNNLIRISKGAMMGVDYNKNRTWIGASTAYHAAA